MLHPIGSIVTRAGWSANTHIGIIIAYRSFEDFYGVRTQYVIKWCNTGIEVYYNSYVLEKDPNFQVLGNDEASNRDVHSHK